MEALNFGLIAKNLIAENPIHASEHETMNEPTFTMKNGYIYQNGDNSTSPLAKATAAADGTTPVSSSTTGSNASMASLLHTDADADASGAAAPASAATTGGGSIFQTPTSGTQYFAPSAQGGTQQLVFQQPTQSPGQSPMQSVGQSPTQSPTQSPLQSPIQSSLQPQPQAHPMRMTQAMPMTTAMPTRSAMLPPVKITPQAQAAGTVDGIIDFFSHCVLGHISFLWKNPMQILTDPVAALKLNELELNPMGHIKNDIYKAAQLKDPWSQLNELPMGLDSIPGISKLGLQPSVMANGMAMN